MAEPVNKMMESIATDILIFHLQYDTYFALFGSICIVNDKKSCQCITSMPMAQTTNRNYGILSHRYLNIPLTFVTFLLWLNLTVDMIDSHASCIFRCLRLNQSM